MGPKPVKKTVAKKQAARAGSAKQPVLLSGGNPQIPKGEGNAPVQAYISAMPGWKRAVGRRLDALIARTVPGVHKAVKWNSPFYGIEGRGWFLDFHTFRSEEHTSELQSQSNLVCRLLLEKKKKKKNK